MFCPFHAADIAPVQPALHRQAFLRHSLLPAGFPRSVAKRFPDNRSMSFLHGKRFDALDLSHKDYYKNPVDS